MADNDILVIGGLGLAYYWYSQSRPRTPYYPVNPSTGQPYTTPPPGTSVVTSPLVIPAQGAINQQITAQNQDITAVAAIGSSVISGLVAAGTITGPVGAAIAAAIAGIVLLVRNLLSDTHLYANQLVQKYENPFGQGVIQIITQIENETNAGTLTLSDATAARDAVTLAWDDYQNAMHNIQTQGTDWYIVSTQSLNNLDNQYYGTTLPNGKTLGSGMGGVYGETPNYGFMSTWMDWLNQTVVNEGGS